MSIFDLFRPKVEEEEIFHYGPASFDKYSSTWAFVRNYVLDEIDKLRKRNDRLSLDAGQTAVIRGQIKALTKLLEIEGPGDRPKAPADNAGEEY